jgi:hypothetical protein
VAGREVEHAAGYGIRGRIEFPGAL